MIALVSYGVDSNPAGASLFVGIPRPVGVKDGDVVLVGIAVPAGITVTPPSADWQQVTSQTDPARAIGLVAFWATALNAPSNWVFALSGAAEAEGAVLIYRGTDAFQPIEVSVPAITAGSSAAHAVGPINPSLDGEVLALLVAADAAGSYTPTASFVEVARRAQTAHTLEAHHRPLQNAGPLSGFNVAFSGAAHGVSLLIALAPSAGQLSYDDARNRLISAMPAGLDQLLDFTPGGDFYNIFSVVSALIKIYLFDLVDLLRLEVIPFTARYKLKDWERLFGLQATRTTQFGTVPQRQAQVLAAWRSAAGQGSAVPAVQAVLGPLLGYFPTTPVEVIQADATALRLLSGWGILGDRTIPNPGTLAIKVRSHVDGKTSSAGARLTLMTALPLTGYTITLRGPDCFTKTWTDSANAWTDSPLVLYAPEFIGRPCWGRWDITLTNPGGVANTLYDGPQLYVDGIGRGLNTGAAVFHWGVYADPLHLGENGTAPDLRGAQDAIQRLAFTHTIGNLILNKAPEPNTPTAIPDRCIPV